MTDRIVEPAVTNMDNRCIALGVHSHYSLMQGTASMRALCREARRMGYSAVGVTDVNNLYGLWSFLRACKEQDVRPVIGADVQTAGRRFFCLVKNKEGYGNLCRLLTRVCGSGEIPCESLVQRFHQGLIILATDPALLHACREFGADGAAALVGIPCRHNSLLRRTAHRLDMEAVAMNAAFFLHRRDFDTHRLLRAIDTNRTLSDPSLEQSEPHSYLASPREMVKRFRQWPEAVAAGVLIAERCEFTHPHLGLVLPPWPGEDAAQKLRSLAFQGAEYRYGLPLPKEVINRLNHELDVIRRMGFSAYFLVVRDIIGRVHRTCGRGSGAASLVAYCLSITNVCPVKHNLYFERFLNPGRSDPPDIDVDFSWDERDGILQSVLKRFHGHAALVSNHVALQPRMAIRETAKVFGLPGGEISRITKKLPWMLREGEEGGFLSHIRSLPQLRGTNLSEPWPRILHLAASIAGAPRHLSVHPGGVVITPEPIDGYVPIEHAPKGVPIIQWEKDGAEEAGLVKIDLLGNRSLGVIRDTLHTVRGQGIPFDERKWQPEDDLPTRESVARGDTMGCFYIESPATRLLQRKAKTGDFEHLVLHSSIIRPAANEFIREYLRRLHGGDWKPLHPLIGNVLDETYGIMVYQEDVSRVAVRFGFSHADADRLRKVMSKKDKQRTLDDFKARFFMKAKERNVPEETAEQIWKMMMSFDGYSFCKPHSASYAKISFQAAYLKTHFPAQFMAAVISNQGGYYSTFAYVSEARRMGLSLLPPDVGKSDRKWTGEGRSLRVGLMAVQGLSRKTMDAVVNQRRQKPFAHMMDFLNRVTPARDEALALIRCGALDRFAAEDGRRTNRSRLSWLLAGWSKPESSMRPLFSLPATPPALPGQDPVERLRDEYRVLGFLCSRHPITLYAEQRRRLGTVPAKEVRRYVSGPQGHRLRIRFMGWMIAGKIVGTRQGKPMEFISFEDETGQVECTFFPETYERYCHMLHTRGPVLLEGYVEQDFGACTLTVERAADRRNGFNLRTPLSSSRRRSGWREAG